MRDADVIAAGLTRQQRQELRHYEDGEGFMPASDPRRARRLWAGVKIRGLLDPVFLIRKLHGRALYALSPIGAAVAEAIARQPDDGAPAGIMLHCPDCDREMMAQRADTDPPTAAVARIQCDRCDDGDTHSPEFYDAAGSWVDPVAHLQETCA